jgi:beta-alanine--pyruvate transaminase
MPGRPRYPHRRPHGRDRPFLAPGRFGKRAFEIMDRAFHEQDLMLRSLGETLVLTPPLIISEAQIGEIFDKLGTLIRETA